jgi:hypothetical protein
LRRGARRGAFGRFAKWRTRIGTHRHALIELWRCLASPRVVNRKPLTTALRRLAFAGERSRPEDQIIDLTIASEAVFLAGEQQESAKKLALRGAVFLRDDSRPVHEVFRHMKRGYNARSTLANGGHIDELKFADGTPAILAEYVDRISDYMRVARQSLARSAANEESLPTSDWDRYILDALSSQRVRRRAAPGKDRTPGVVALLVP